jgi:hypothetical protein
MMAVVEERRTNAERDYRRNIAERLAQTIAVAVRSGPRSATFRHIDDEFIQADTTYLATQAELHNRPPHIRFENPWLFWPPAVLVFLIEAYVNKIIVDMAAQTPGGLSLLISGVVSLVLVWLAHNAGVSWRQIWSELNRRLEWMTLIQGVALVVIVLTMVTLLITLRAYFALVDTTSNGGVFDAVQGIASLGFDFIPKAFAVPEALTIGGLNFLALTFAFLFAMFSHDSDREYDRRYRDMKAARERRNKAIARYEEMQDRVQQRFSEPIGRALRIYVANGGELDALSKDDFKTQRAEAEAGPPPPPPPSPPPPPPAPPAPPPAPPEGKGESPW